MSFLNNGMEADIDLLAIFRAILKQFWLIAFVGLITASATLGATKYFVEPKYAASVSLYVNNTTGSSNVSYITSSDISASIMLTSTYLTIISSDLILDEVLDTVDLDYDTVQLSKMLTTGSVTNTEVLKIQVTSSDPKEAALLANTIGEVASERLPEIVQGSSVKILDSAKIPTVKSSPNYIKRTVVGGFFGGLLGVLFVIISVLMDKRVKSEKDLEVWNVPILGVIPDMNIKQHKDRRGYGYGYYK